MKKALGIIPARYASTRFPGKPLALIGNKPMIRLVYEAAFLCRELDRVVVATDDERIEGAVREFGGEAVLTRPDHKTGTDRIREVTEKFADYEYIVNIQGDEPGIEPALIEEAVLLKRKNPQWEMTTAARPFKPGEDPSDPNRVKVVISRTGRALYFSRSLIPHPREEQIRLPLLHLGLYVYNRQFLMDYPALPASHLEETEMLEQLRVLENDGTIGVHVARDSLPGVDTPEDLQAITEIFRSRGLL